MARLMVQPQAEVRNHMWWHTPGNRLDEIGNPTPTKGEGRGEGGGREAQGRRKASRPGTGNASRDTLAAKKADTVGLEVTDKSTRSRASHREVLANVGNESRSQGLTMTRKIINTKPDIGIQQTEGHQTGVKFEAKAPELNNVFDG